ncbi:MAG: PAS domain-containing protein, partial [Myxococcales bacterium]|nr:PAS domain-containing protein [Myxococcales bacterium]
MDPRDLHNVLDAVLDGLIVVDAGGRIAHVNSEACRILESSPEKIRGTPLADHFGPAHPVLGLERRVREERRGRVLDDVRIERRFDRALEVDVAISPIELGVRDARATRPADPYEDEEEIDEPGDGVVIELRDHTLRSSLREKEKQRDELQRYGHIAAGIAHEVKNPLGGIRGAAELLGMWSESPRAKDTSALIVREVDRITALVDELMVFARGDALELSRINIHRILDAVIELEAMDALASGISFEREYDPS